MGGSVSATETKYAPEAADHFVPYPAADKPFFSVAPDAEVKIRTAPQGLASEAPSTVMKVFKDAATKCATKNAMSIDRGGQWTSWTWQQYYNEVCCAARAFIALGLTPFQSVNIIGFNSPEWFMANMAAIAAQGKAAGIYTTNGPEACQYISAHSEAAFVVCENEMQLNKFLQIRDNLSHLKGLIMWEGKLPANANQAGKVPVYTWAEFMAFGQGTPAPVAGDEKARTQAELQAELDKRIEAQHPGHCCTLIYTSGTTGNPKAVMISHDNVTWTAKSLLTLLPGLGQQPESIVSYLPLSHVAAQMIDIHSSIHLASRGLESCVFFAKPTALKGTLTETLTHAKPTLFFGVPRVWEKIMEKMKAVGAKTGGLAKKIAMWAKDKGAQKYKATQVQGDGKAPSGVGAGLAKLLVFSKVRAKLGLDRCRMCMTGAAPIAKEVLNFFGQLDIPIIEVYGMSECTGPQNTGRYNYFQAGSCGVPIPGVELKIDHDATRDKAGEGEICYRGRHIMMGYMKDPAKTQSAIDDEGWLHSGDVGRVDENGLMWITGRIKELIITAGGENVAPVPIEDAIKAACPAISNVMVVGDRRKYNTCLVTLKQKQDLDTNMFTDELVAEAKAVNPEVKTLTAARADAKWQAYVQSGLDAANEVAVSRASRVQKFTILPVDFGVPTGELTATLKLKRPIVMQKYHDEIEAMYTGANEQKGAGPAAAAAAAAAPAAAAAGGAAPAAAAAPAADADAPPPNTAAASS